MNAISNEMVRIYKAQFGRGPTKTRTTWAGPDMLLVTLEDSLTRAELNLQQMGEHERLRQLRLLFQHADASAFCEPVERLTGRKVRAFISGIDTRTDVCSELFLLHPVGYAGSSRADLSSSEVNDRQPPRSQRTALPVGSQ